MEFAQLAETETLSQISRGCQTNPSAPAGSRQRSWRGSKYTPCPGQALIRPIQSFAATYRIFASIPICQNRPPNSARSNRATRSKNWQLKSSPPQSATTTIGVTTRTPFWLQNRASIKDTFSGSRYLGGGANNIQLEAGEHCSVCLGPIFAHTDVDHQRDGKGDAVLHVVFD